MPSEDVRRYFSERRYSLLVAQFRQLLLALVVWCSAGSSVVLVWAFFRTRCPFNNCVMASLEGCPTIEPLSQYIKARSLLPITSVLCLLRTVAIHSLLTLNIREVNSLASNSPVTSLATLSPWCVHFATFNDSNEGLKSPLQWVDYACSYIPSNLSWRLPLLMQCVIGTVLAVGSLLIPESPR